MLEPSRKHWLIPGGSVSMEHAYWMKSFCLKLTDPSKTVLLFFLKSLFNWVRLCPSGKLEINQGQQPYCSKRAAVYWGRQLSVFYWTIWTSRWITNHFPYCVSRVSLCFLGDFCGRVQDCLVCRVRKWRKQKWETRNQVMPWTLSVLFGNISVVNIVNKKLFQK